MITLDLGSQEYYDDEKNEFITETGGIVRFEYSLKAIYDWEYKWRKPFLKGNLSREEYVDFYLTMALDPVDVKFITDDVIFKLSKYISDSSTATVFNKVGESSGKVGNTKLYTSEELYALMALENIPIEFENRNLNRLLTILRVIASYKEPPKKMSKEDIYKQNAELNRLRREQMKTKG